MDEGTRTASPAFRAAVLKLAVLLLLFIWAFHSELRTIVGSTFGGDGILAVAAPLAVACLFVLLRSILSQSLAGGSFLGVLLAMAGVFWYAVFTWPYDYAFLRLVALPGILGGCILVAAGKSTLKHVMPFLLLLLLCVPLGGRAYAALIVKPETLTLQMAASALGFFPNLQVSLSGSDLIYQHGEAAGAIALGESNRGMMMLSAYALIGVFVVFSQVRPFWQIAVAVLAGGPIVLAANFARVMTWGLVTVYGGCNPVSEVPRNVAGMVSLLSAYVMFGAWCLILSWLVMDEPDAAEAERVDDA